MKRVCLASTIAVLAAQISAAQLIGFFPEGGGKMSLETTSGPIQVGLIYFQADDGVLSLGPDPAPFALSARSGDSLSNVLFGGLPKITLEGTVELDMQVSADATAADISAMWDEAPFPVTATPPTSTNRLFADFPEDGGPISLRAREPFATRAIRFDAAPGILSAGGSAAPYESVVENSSTRWVAESSTPVTIDGSVTLDVFASDSAGRNDITGRVTDADFNRFLVNTSPTRYSKTGTLTGAFGPGPDNGAILLQAGGRSVATTSLRLTAVSGSLSVGDGPQPYETLETNTTTEWFASTSDLVTYRGSQSLEVRASPDAIIRGEAMVAGSVRPFVIRDRGPGSTTQLSTHVSTSGAIAVESDFPVTTRGLDFIAYVGSFSSSGSSAPYGSLANNTVSRWTANSNTDVVIDGRVELDLTASDDARFDAIVDIRSNRFEMDVVRETPDIHETRLIGTFPPGGGNITLTTTQGPIDAGGIEFVAEPGDLTQGVSAAPFAFFIPGQLTDRIVTLGSLGAPVRLEGSVELDVAAAADAQIEATWGDGFTPVPFPVSNQGIEGIEGIAASVPFDGGAITLSPLREPISARGISIETTIGTLTGGGSAAPFETLTANTPSQWSVESSADVTIDGPIELDVVASKGSQLTGIATKANGTVPIAFSQDEPLATARLHGSYTPGGPVSIIATDGPVSTRTLDLQIEGSEADFAPGGSAAPYQRLVANARTRWTATSDVDVVLDGMLTLDVEVLGSGPVNGLVSNGSTTSAFEVRQRETSSQLVGHYDMLAGGPVSLTAAGQPVSIQQLELSAANGQLTGGDDPTPFDSVVSNTDQKWTAESSANVMIDGTVELNVRAERGTAVSGQFFDGSDLFALGMNRIDAGELGFDEDFELAAVYPPQGGRVRLVSNSPVSVGGIELVAEPGVLTKGESSEPFPYFMPTPAAPGNVQLGILGTPVIVDGFVELDVVVAPNTQAGAIAATWNNGESTLAFSIVPELGSSLHGDFDNDQIVDLSDADLLVSAIASGENSLSFDLTNDGLVNRNDLTIFITGDLITTGNKLFGDTDFNGAVDFTDFLTLAEHWRDDIAKWSVGDFDATGEVTFADFLYISQNFGQSSEAVAVPEPNSVYFALIGLGSLLVLRRRK